MTNEEMREALVAYCKSREGCYNLETKDECPLFTTLSAGTRGCYAMCTPEEIEINYEIVFGKEEPIEVEKEVDMVNHPPHYTNGGMECIDELIYVFGTHAVKAFCLCNVWKYRKRALYKNGQEDLDKADWYMAKYKELEGEGNEIYKRLP